MSAAEKFTMTDAPADRPEIAEGIYSSPIGLLRVTYSKTSGRPYGSEWDGSKWAYRGGLYAAMRDADATLASVEELAAAGVESGFCLVCSRMLPAPESIERGIDPICASTL